MEEKPSFGCKLVQIDKVQNKKVPHFLTSQCAGYSGKHFIISLTSTSWPLNNFKITFFVLWLVVTIA